MADLTMTIEYDEETPRNGAVAVLKFASLTLKALRSIDRNMAKEQGRKERVVWDVNIYSLSDRAVVEFTVIDPKHRRDAHTLGERFTEQWGKSDG
jgi:hypothetical protein